MDQQMLVARKMVMIVVPLLMVMAVLIVGAGSHAGSASASGDVPFCLSDELLSESLRANPELQKTLDAQEQTIRNYVENLSSKRQELQAATSNYIIPVVVYVVHGGGSENISDQQVNSQIAALNTAFSGHGIEFCLATKQGAASLPGLTPGIIRINDSVLTNHKTAQESTLKALSVLPGDKYLRIWVVQNIDNGTPTSGVVGYARFPGTVPVALEGIVMRYDVFGDAATCGICILLPNYDKGKILAHEVGHYLNLFHTFHGGCSGIFPSDCATDGDRVCDTPQIASANTGCPGAPGSCDGTPALVDNHMDYTNDVCRNTFTAGQDTRMLATLNTARQLLISPQNLVFTGVQCAGLNASFAANDSNPCTNTPVTFTAINNAGASYNWNFGDGNTGTGNPITHTYLSPGTYTVTLTVSSATDSVSNSTQVFVTACPPIHSSQGNWYFAGFAGLNFSTGVPVADLSGKLKTGDGEATVTQSDINGNLLFYSDGVEVYDRNHTLMNPGSPLNGNTSNAQAGISVPDPANPNRYYLFTLGPFAGGSAKLWYTLVDLTTSPGILTHVNTPVAVPAPLAEELTAVPHCNGHDYWVIVHASKTNTFFAYLLTASGISVPVVSSVAQPGIFGSLKASPDGTMIAQSTLGQDASGSFILTLAAVFDFNKTTGVITLRNVLDHGNYGASFSPDSQLLYVSERGGAVYQYDLTVPDPNATVATVGQVPGLLVSLQLGPNQKIYLTTLGRFSLAVINSPNQRNTTVQPNAAGFNGNGPSLAGRSSAWGLPNMIDARPTASIPPDFSYTISSCSTVTFNAPACATSYAWNFGDSTTSNAQNPTHTYDFSGNAYTVTVKLTLNGSTTVTHDIAIGLPASSATIFGPSQVCLASGLPFYNYSANTQPGLTYNWTVTNGSISGFGNNDNVDVVWSALPGEVQLTVTDPATGCTATKTLTVIENCNPNQCVAPPAEIVNWWPFDERSGSTAQDIRGFVNNAGAHINGPTLVAGVVAGALSFNGNQWVEVANDPELNFLGGCILDFAEPMTIDLWVKTNIQPGTGPSSGLLTILDKRVNTASPNGYHLFLFNGRLGFQMSGINHVAPATGPDYIDVADNQWHFVAVSLPMCRGVGSGFLYIDGKTVLTLPRATGFDNTAKFYIGRRDPAFGPNFFKGALDELEMFKSALSEDELRALFEARSRGKCKADCSTKTITISPAALPQLTWPVNVPYPTVTLTGSGGAAPYNFAVTGGNLPPGMTLNSSGTLLGAPTQPGLYNFTVTVIDADGCRATRNYQLRVKCPGIESDLVNWWPFDETSGTTARDFRGATNNFGTHVNGANPGLGKVGGALCFDGVDDYVAVLNNDEVNFLGDCSNDAAEAFTISTWVRTTQSTGLAAILDKRSSGPVGYHLFLFNGRLGFQMAVGSNFTNFVSPSSNVADGEWHLVSVTATRCRGGQGRLYVDGNLALSFTPLVGSIDNTATLNIGRRDPAHGDIYFNGCIDELEFFKRALSEDEIRTIFNTGSTGDCSPPPCPPTITCPANIVVDNSNRPGQCSAVVNYTVSATASCSSVTVACSPPSGSVFPKGTTTVSCTATNSDGTAACSFTVTVIPPQLTNLSPARVWIGVGNSDDVGMKFDLLAEVLKNGAVVGTGQLNDVPGGSVSNNAVLRKINLALSGPVDICPGDALGFRLSVRVAAASGHTSGTARLWYDDATTNSLLGATIGGATNDYFLRFGFVLNTAAGPGPKRTIDVSVNRKVGGNPFKPFGIWSITF